jgi:transcriptional regulator with XRE-family HTH domain
MVDIDFIKNAAKAKRITLRELAERIGYSVPGFYRACSNNYFKIDALQKLGEVLQITPESYIKDERSLKIIQALSSNKIEPEGNSNLKSIDQILEGERKHFEEEIAHYRKQLDVKDKQIEYLMNQLEQKDNLLHTSMTLLRGMGVNINDKTKTENL